MSKFGRLATEVTSGRDLNAKTSEQQCVQERRTRDEADLYTYAKKHSVDAPLDDSEKHEERIPPKPRLFKLADLIVKGPREGETFADRIAKYVTGGSMWL